VGSWQVVGPAGAAAGRDRAKPPRPQRAQRMGRDSPIVITDSDSDSGVEFMKVVEAVDVPDKKRPAPQRKRRAAGEPQQEAPPTPLPPGSVELPAGKRRRGGAPIINRDIRTFYSPKATGGSQGSGAAQQGAGGASPQHQGSPQQNGVGTPSTTRRRLQLHEDAPPTTASPSTHRVGSTEVGRCPACAHAPWQPAWQQRRQCADDRAPSQRGMQSTCGRPTQAAIRPRLCPAGRRRRSSRRSGGVRGRGSRAAAASQGCAPPGGGGGCC